MNFCILNAKISPHIIAVHVASRRSLCGVETKCKENYCRVSILYFLKPFVFRIRMFVYWMQKFHCILLPFTSLVVGHYVASKLNVKKIIVEFQSSYFLMPYVISYQRQSLIVRICKVTSTHKKKCPQINFRLIFSIILWIKKLFKILPTLTITVFKKIDHCIKLFRKKQLKCDNLTTLYRDMYFIVCNTFSSE